MSGPDAGAAPGPGTLDAMDLQFTGDVWHWRGPAPYHFVRVPPEESLTLREMSAAVTYGWGMIPVRAWVAATTWRTSLFPKDGRYLVPLKDAVRRAEGLDVGDTVTIGLTVASRRPAGARDRPGRR